MRTKYGSEPNMVLLLQKGIKYDIMEVIDVSDKVRILRIVDKETGEIEADIKLPDRTFGKKGWLAMFQDALSWIGEQHMTGEQLSVLCKLLGKLEFDNRIIYDRKDIAESIGMHPQHVSRAMRVLKDKEIIYEDPNNKNVYKLNPYIGHKGTKNYNSNVVEFEKAKFDKLDKMERLEDK